MLGLARTVLAVGGSVMTLAGLALAALGLFAAGWIRSQLPPVVIDAAAVGGATFALGLFTATAGVGQIGVAMLLPRGGRWIVAAAATLAGLLAALYLACGVAAVTQVAGGGGSISLLVVGVAMAGAAIPYGASAWVLARASAQSRR